MPIGDAFFSLASRNLKYKLKISFYLMSILPILVCIYLIAHYVLPTAGLKLDILIVLGMSFFIAIIGFWVIKEIFDRVVNVSVEAKRVVPGDVDRQSRPGSRDEVDDLRVALNHLTRNIRSNISELKTYGEKTDEVNFEIQQRVGVLSSLLHINSLISQGSELDEILKLIVEKSRQLASSDASYLLFRDEGHKTFFMKTADGSGHEDLFKVTIEPREELFGKIFSVNKPLLLDSQNNSAEYLKMDFQDKFKMKNTAALPVYVHGRVAAFLGIGNTAEGFSYRREDIDMLSIFAKQTAVAIENDALLARVARMEIKDALTGLYNGAYISSRLDEEIKRVSVSQSSCALVLLDVDKFKDFYQRHGFLQSERALKRVASIITDVVSEIGCTGRIDDDEFAVLLPERNKRQAHDIGETIRRKIEIGMSDAGRGEQFTVCGGISENPLDGTSAGQLIDRAREMLSLAKSSGRNRVMSFKEPPVCL